MKNLLVTAVTIALGYLLWDVLQPPPAPPPLAVAATTPVPMAAPKLYFHSALDAPAMLPSQHTGTSYFSTDSGSRFSAGYTSLGYGTVGAYEGGGPTIVIAPGGQATKSVLNVPGTTLAARASSLQAQYARREVAKATPNPGGVAR